MARFRGTISLEIPDGATREDVAYYIVVAVGSWHGCLEPHGARAPDSIGNPMFYLDSDSVSLECVINGEQIRYINQ